ncbi:efflux RND transporter periplasmic adaptor subunit [Kordiimonas sp. SCSIO 12603]|uniref:efflux RND transporter periplasmic adaptor subunit n=1 Tax=Kordiimonas sp. SCSIO 12603 TaxID=2829596 RepID=UPI002102EC41|nr:efflux RND transporter periplasmic adaptor subunit [Kordiimonas sp. SCSIO 12603]
MRKIAKIAAPISVVVAAAIGLNVLAASKEAPETTPEAPRTVSLYVEQVRAENVTLSVTTQGEVTPKTQINLVPQVNGRIVKVSDVFAEGGAFEPNTTLIQIDDSDYKLAVISQEARVAQAKVQLERQLADARIKKKQWQDWVKDGTPTPLALNAPQVAEAQANMRAAEADLETAKLNLARTTISVPFKGRVAERSIGLGQFVSQGTQLGRVFATDTVEVRLPLTDAQLAELNLPIGFIAGEIPAPNVTFSASMGTKTFQWEGKIVRINASIDQQTRLVYAIAEVNDPYGAAADHNVPLAVGMFVNAEIQGVAPRNAMVLPRLALRSEDKVYVISDSKLQIRTVDIMATTRDHLYVSSGVQPGDQVVTSPVLSAVEGMTVEAITKTADAQNTTSE